jgi:hypothetical protein
LLEVVFVGFNVGFKVGNLLFEVPLLLNMALLPNSDGTDQRCSDASECNGINVSFYGKGCGNGAGGSQMFDRWSFLDSRLGERERVRGYRA